MREALGTTFIVNLIVIFIIIFVILFAGSTGYTKAYKVKNQIVNIIEENRGVIGATTKKEINDYLGRVGYKVGGKVTLPKKCEQNTNGYRYCIEKIDQSGDGENGRKYYYRVTTYMYLEIPIIASLIQIPVSGETKTFGILETTS